MTRNEAGRGWAGRLRAVAVAALAAAAGGCGGGGGLEPVSGQVLYRGRPAAGAAVFFHREGSKPGDGPVPTGVVDDRGRFRLTSGDLGNGAPPGRYTVLIGWEADPTDAKGPGERARPGSPPSAKGRRASRVPADRFEGRYLDLRAPKFRAEVGAGGADLPPFELTDGAGDRRRASVAATTRR